jgi:pseudouridine-5'-phosphate glycosidase
MNASAPDFSRELQNAISLNRPIVMLETTVIAQGLPWPDNLQTAREMEEAVRDSGAVPATIAVLDGVVRIGLAETEIEQLARSAAPSRPAQDAEIQPHRTPAPRPLAKANRRDLGVLIAQGLSAATTVSATLWLAQRSGFKPCLMATGGLGGVHRGAAESFDVSTDLDELARADGSMIVCSGFKSILDLQATLEALETRGVTIVGYRTSDLPAFTTVSSRLVLEHRVESPAEAAAILRAHRSWGLPGAVVLAQPVPDSVALERDEMETAVEAAIAEARRRNIAGKAMTPFLLDVIRQMTGGRSLQANRALLVANARLAAEVAVALQR